MNDISSQKQTRMSFGLSNIPPMGFVISGSKAKSNTSGSY